MTLSQSSFSRRPAMAAPRIVPDRRRHKRVTVNLLGRFMRANRHEYPCRLVDVSVGGAAILAPLEVRVGERIVAYFDHLGGIEGNVTRFIDAGFAIEITATQYKREKLAAQLMWLLNREELASAEERRHARMVLSNHRSVLVLPEGNLACDVLDVSLSGASVGTDARPALGEEIMVGKLRCRVVRHHDRGIGVEFLDIQKPAALRSHFGR
jgi:PilZ domain